ncbi:MULTISPECIES: thermonuclease family protein [Prochlorococcus]|uniref:thermonuclease family protein n=1 Tax=Prochlorococcus TaxID=1218 RepID=UPI000533B987|nr:MULTISPECIES: thermonuclease family protein [Prochlorococcus]KGG12727.1 nuclease (SNase-like) protein [Prochlorococcus sp. MIT 0601]
MIKGCFGCVTDLFKIGFGALIVIVGINYYSNRSALVTIKSCYDGDTCTTTKGEKIRLACIDTPELRGSRADPVPAKAARDYLNKLVAGEQVSIRRINIDRFGRTVSEISKDRMNIQKILVSKGYAQISQRYADQCRWSR